MRLRATFILFLLVFGRNSASTSDKLSGLSVDFQCMVCHWGADVLVSFAKKGSGAERDFIAVVAKMCHFFGIESKEVCSAMVKSVGVQLFDILRESRGRVSAYDICGMVREGECARHSPRMSDWALSIDDLNRRSPIPVPLPVPAGSPKQKVLHLSDPHVLLDYTIGSLAKCNLPSCCSASNGFPSNKKDAAGYFGDYKCDLPPWALDHMLADIRARHKDIDYVLITGDFPAHDIWRQNRTRNLESIRLVASVMKKHFGDIPVLPAIGNHESFPVNMFPDTHESAGGKYDVSWLYGNVAKYFQHWLPNAEQQKSIREGGFYSLELRPGLRVVAINTNVCNNLNFFLLLNFDDPSRHLHWIYRELHEAESQGDKVFILGHIPPGRDSCFNHWAHEYHRLIRRFNNTIVGQFFGHTHFDEFEVFYEDSTPIGVAYLAPSLTPHEGINPAYRIYEIDGQRENSTSQIVDHQTYFYDLEATLAQNRLVSRYEYSAVRSLDLDDLSPKSWHEYVLRLASDRSAFDEYRSRYYRFGPVTESVNCGTSCRKQLLCNLVTAESGELHHCAKVEALVDANERQHEESRNSFNFWSYIWGE